MKNIEKYSKNKNTNNEKQCSIHNVSDSNINRLKVIKEASVTDLLDGDKLVWLMKKIILEQNERIEQLEFKVAELRGEVEPD